MVTVIDLTEEEVRDLKEYTSQNDVATAVRAAMTEYLRYARRMRLKALSGSVEMQDHASERGSPR